MTIHLAERIRSFRKERKMTQEQLAEVLGVTVGAVSKWEAGASTPDIGLIVDMANFFETSVDVLLGYEWRGGGMEQTIARMRALRNEKKFDEASVEAEKALQKYPNSFDAVFQSAVLYAMKGVERRCKRSSQRALTLFERALALIDQNTNERVNEWSIRNSIADVYMSLGQTEKALEQLKKNNAAGLNNTSIGFFLACIEHRGDEATPYLSDALVDGVTTLSRVMLGFCNAYSDKKDYAGALGALQWMLGVLAGLRQENAVSYLDRESVQFLSGCASVAILAGEEETARSCLREARKLAKRFDAAPVYNYVGMRFYAGDGKMTAFDDFGDTCMAGIEREIAEDEKTAPTLWEMWEELRREELEQEGQEA